MLLCTNIIRLFFVMNVNISARLLHMMYTYTGKILNLNISKLCSHVKILINWEISVITLTHEKFKQAKNLKSFRLTF